MKNKPAFSLAEALITLLIVSVIAIVSAPILTKKARTSPAAALWINDTMLDMAVTPSGERDIKLGTERNGKNQGIVVIEKMYFKDRKGNIIGWIAEDGSSSFASSSGGGDYDYAAMAQKQEQIMQMLTVVTEMLQEERAKTRINASDSEDGRNTWHGKSRRSNDKSYGSSEFQTNAQINNDELQKQLDELIKTMNAQKR